MDEKGKMGLSVAARAASNADDDAVEAKRANLLHAKGDLAVGRREAPQGDSDEKRSRRKRIVWGAALGALALIAVFVLIAVLAADISLDSRL